MSELYQQKTASLETSRLIPHTQLLQVLQIRAPNESPGSNVKQEVIPLEKLKQVL